MLMARPTPIPARVTRRVRRGAALLDTHYSVWMFEVNPLTLDIADPRMCVLGQIYGHYGEGLEHLNMRWWAWGPRAPRHFGFSGRDKHMAVLTNAWRIELRRRLA